MHVNRKLREKKWDAKCDVHQTDYSFNVYNNDVRNLTSGTQSCSYHDDRVDLPHGSTPALLQNTQLR